MQARRIYAQAGTDKRGAGIHKVRMELDTIRDENAFSEEVFLSEDTTSDENAFSEELHTKLAACDTAVARLDERVGSVSDQAQGDNT
jgi:hypothetical protein